MTTIFSAVRLLELKALSFTRTSMLIFDDASAVLERKMLQGTCVGLVTQYISESPKKEKAALALVSRHWTKRE